MHKTSVLHIKIRPFGERYLELIWPQEISDLQLNEINCIIAELQHHYQNLLQDVVSTYANLLLVYKNPIDVNSEINALKHLLGRIAIDSNRSCNRWIIPVCYDYTLAQDLEWFCKSKGLTVNSFINLHSGRDYRLHFYGFLPGFFYLGGLDSKLHMPRRSQPRSKVAQGTVAIGGEQTGIYPQDSPGGWHCIGKTPVSLFNSAQKQPVFAQVGDVIQFRSIDSRTYQEMCTLPNSQLIKKEHLV